MTEQKKSPYVKTFSCPSCGGSVTIRAIGSSLNVVCSYCSSIIDTSNENYIVIETFTNKKRKKQIIELGDRGNLFGTLWENIGYMERKDQSGKYTWSEYLLFNPMQGFRWLTEYGGHWSFVKTIKDKPESDRVFNSSNITYKNTVYSLFNKGTATISFVIGEFYWQIRIGEKVDLIEFIAPPEILSIERSEDEVNWSIGSYINANLIRDAFSIKKIMPNQVGIAPNQPSPYNLDLTQKITKYWKLFLITLTCIQLYFFLIPDSDIIYSSKIEFRSNDIEKTKVSQSFEVNEKETNLRLNFHTPLNDSWLELQVELINDDTGDSIEFEEGIEYYSGYDSDGHWSEGSETTEKIITAIPKGRYHLNIEASGPNLLRNENADSSIPSWNSESPPVIVTIEVKTGATIWSNFILSLILLSLFPIVILWRRHSFESGRWSESDYSPYNSSEED